MAESTDLRHWLTTGAAAMKGARDRLDSINVFPVADADTGTNLYLTVREGNRAVAKLPATATHREVVAAFTRGALLGARGNSGVILSQYLTTFLSKIDARGGMAKASSSHIADALEAAADSAYGAVGSPVEGTILTVARSAANYARAEAAGGASRDRTVVAAVEAAREALMRTHEQLPSAHEAGVVDAGAAGLVLQLEMLAETIAGPDALAGVDEVRWEVRDQGLTVSADDLREHHGGAYEVMFVARDEHDIRDALTGELETIGDSVAVTGAHELWQAHVHTDVPHDAVVRGIEAHARQIIVRNITMGHDADRASTGVVALTACPGLAEPLADAGAVVLVVPDPESISRRALKRAVKDASGAAAIIVAGDPRLRAEAAELAQKRRKKPFITVLDAQHEAHVVSAVAAAALVTPGQDLEEEMAAAIERTVVGSSTGDALDEDIDSLVSSQTEVVSLILADGVAEAVTDSARTSVAGVAPFADVHVYRGGHHFPGVLIGVESGPEGAA
ncbi:DAK2 domain-containing protein [Demequina sediminicola]|uniref:DAK2 domain-containing protein n=1 Tax=Demequina sediminicola TaxID=1095026 RepID=UPI0007868157|nr:DAK2 domain-containing protein [Demequina sediminicola]